MQATIVAMIGGSNSALGRQVVVRSLQSLLSSCVVSKSLYIIYADCNLYTLFSVGNF